MNSHTTLVDLPNPTVIESEVNLLVQRYGPPLRRSLTVAPDATAVRYRFGDQGDRRAEVVFVIQEPGGGLWVHAKAHYPRSISRLPSGGIRWDEVVEDALMREIAEESGLEVVIERFLGLLQYRFVHEGNVAHFASYAFYVRSCGGVPIPQCDEAITEFRQVLPSQLLQIAADLRNLMGDRRNWGQWRALVHELVYDALSASHAGNP